MLRPTLKECVRTAVAAAFTLLVTPDTSKAEDPVVEIWTGVSATENTWLTYEGITWAPVGSLYSEGWRLRAVEGYGQYRYSHAAACKLDDYCHGRSQNYNGAILFVDALVGYQKHIGELTAHAWLGVSYIDHTIRPFDSSNATIGPEIGIKGALELWYDPGGLYWFSLNGSFTTAHDTYAIHSRTGFRLSENWSAGPELALDATSIDTVDIDGAFARSGAFVRYTWSGGELSASGGLARDVEASMTPYATINLAVRF